MVDGANMSFSSALKIVVKGIVALCLCAIGVLGLMFAWFLLVFAEDAAGHETEARVKAVALAIGTVAVVGTGLYLLFRTPRPLTLDSPRCNACGANFPSQHYLQDAGKRGNICSACAARDQSTDGVQST